MRSPQTVIRSGTRIPTCVINHNCPHLYSILFVLCVVACDVLRALEFIALKQEASQHQNGREGKPFILVRRRQREALKSQLNKQKSSYFVISSVIFLKLTNARGWRACSIYYILFPMTVAPILHASNTRS
jgi:membrane-associated PAP2 superfamily phosphatase